MPSYTDLQDHESQNGDDAIEGLDDGQDDVALGVASDTGDDDILKPWKTSDL